MNDDMDLLRTILGIPDDYQWDEHEKWLAASQLRNWVTQYGEDVIREKRRGFLLSLSNQGQRGLRAYL
ncbi:hypothetical protein [Desulfovibrio aminophilus]|uniref:hypothetical protein n=1 Tax=Desulfovibrio aminophilus TaxID=81425 RepID=UPI00339B923F